MPNAISACDFNDSGDIFAYAVSYDWLEGAILSGAILSWNGKTWEEINGLEGPLIEFSFIDDLLLLCTNQGFGVFQAATAKKLWWKSQQGCPIVNDGSAVTP